MHDDIDKLPEGGRGIKIMSKLADQLSYTRTPDEQNCLSIVKNYEQPTLAPSQSPQKRNVLDRVIEFFQRLLNWFKFKRHPQQLCDTPLQKINLQVKTDLNELDQVLQWFSQLEHLPISKAVLWQCKLALAEGFTNAVRHAHKDLPSETPIQLEIVAFKETLEVRIWDYGQPFDLEAKLTELSEVDQVVENGYGLSAMLQLAAQVSYTRTSDDQNCLVIVKRLSPPSAP